MADEKSNSNQLEFASGNDSDLSSGKRDAGQVHDLDRVEADGSNLNVDPKKIMRKMDLRIIPIG